MPFPFVIAAVRISVQALSSFAGRAGLKHVISSDEGPAAEAVERVAKAAYDFIMNMKIDVEPASLRRTLVRIDNFGKQVNFAAAKALTRVAQDVRLEVMREIEVRIERPTRWTKASIRYSPATRSELAATVYVRKDGEFSPASLLAQQFRGGARIAKRYEEFLRRAGLLSQGEYTVPGSAARLDAYGNIARAQLTQIWRALGKQPKRKTPKASKRAGVIFWADGSKHLAKGAWLATSGSVKPLLLVARPPRYQRRIDLHEVARRLMRDRLQRYFNEELANALRTAK